ncbi:hypothetical protein KKH36_03420 [Patescibacteria group bacterium]|nr:hypothetical protein [Patescibacteria group bacterium]
MYQNQKDFLGFKFFSQYLYAQGYIPVVGSKERRRRGNGIEIHEIYQGVPFSWDKNLGVFVVFDENGHPWVTNQKANFDHDISKICERGAYVPHTWKKSGFFDCFYESQKITRGIKTSKGLIECGFSCIVACDIWLLSLEDLSLFNEVQRFNGWRNPDPALKYLQEYPKIRLGEPKTYQLFENFILVFDGNGFPWTYTFTDEDKKSESYEKLLNSLRKYWNHEEVLKLDEDGVIERFITIGLFHIQNTTYPTLDKSPADRRKDFIESFDKAFEDPYSIYRC